MLYITVEVSLAPSAMPSAVPTMFLLPTSPSGSSAVAFSFTGGKQTYIVPDGVGFILIDACGGRGGGGDGGFGGYVSVFMPVTPLSTLYV